MKPLSDEQLDHMLARWTAPEPPPGLGSGVWARVDSARPSLLQNAWAFRLAAGLTVVLWIAVVLTPARPSTITASESLTVALAWAGGAR
ncbi:MAG TPA: hypothetical protein PKE12_04580 [Kiritimatiellia bacterium]|nr:hypothetical protein [Kiritimatiellia bacterium]